MSVSLAPNWAITNAPAYGHLGWYNEEDQGVAYHWGNNMTKPIVQSVTFKASPEELFEIFTDSKKHSAATGAKASTSAKAGAKFTAFEGMLSGRNLLVIPGRMIVQAWRASHWKDCDLDSILVLNFSNTPGGGRIDLVHAGVPQHDHQGVTKGWPLYYWEPSKAYLKGRSARG
jgi:activator of HSP90 ATPase